MLKHWIYMLIGCALPFLLIFAAPALGLDGDIAFFIFILAMFACHLFMPMHHHGHGSPNEDTHATHQH